MLSGQTLENVNLIEKSIQKIEDKLESKNSLNSENCCGCSANCC